MRTIDPDKLEAVCQRISTAIPEFEVATQDPGSLAPAEYLIRRDDHLQRIRIDFTRFEDYATAEEIFPDQPLRLATLGESFLLGSETITLEVEEKPN